MPVVAGSARKQAGMYYDYGGAKLNVVHPQFGADPTGVLDSSAAFQAANDLAALGGVREVFVPDGIYKIVTAFQPSSFVKFRGNGEKSIIRGATANMNVVVATAKTNVGFEKLAFEGNNSAALGIILNQCTFSAVKDCWFSGFTGLNVSGYGGGVHAYLCDDLLIEGNQFSANGVLVGGLTSDIQINGNGVAVDCNKRVRVHKNVCMSTAVQTNIAMYDVAYSSATENICSGAKTQASNNNGYAIMLYKTVNANAGTARFNRVENNLVFNVDGTGVYIQSQNDCVVNGNVIENAGKVQDDATLQVGGIVFSNSPKGTAVGNSIKDCGHTGIVIGGIAPNCFGFTIGHNEIDTVTIGLGIGIKLNGPILNSAITSNTIRNTVVGIGTPPVNMSADGLTISDNTIETTTGNGGIELYGVSRTVVANNRLKSLNRDGILITIGTFCAVIGNEIWDGGISVDNTYSGIDIAAAPDTTVIGNVGGNTGGTGFKHFVFVNGTSPRSQVLNNKGVGARTSNYNVDATFGNQILFAGNFDPSVTNPQIFPFRQQAVLQGSAASMVQLLLGDSSSVGAVGTRWSGGDCFMSTNAVHIQGADTWHQSLGAAQSKLLILRANGDLEFYSTAAGTADGNFVTFWGTMKAGFTATGQLKTSATTFLQSLVALTNGAAAAAATLTNSPVAGNPTKWIPINDFGTTRYIPAW